jgi:hypothetical protein
MSVGSCSARDFLIFHVRKLPCQQMGGGWVFFILGTSFTCYNAWSNMELPFLLNETTKVVIGPLQCQFDVKPYKNKKEKS